MTAVDALQAALQQPFMQRALIGGLLTGCLGGLLGSFAVLRQLSFFSDALGHSALLGVSIAVLLNLNPTLVLIPFAVLFALLVNQLVQRSRLPTDALLNIVYSSSLAFAVVVLSHRQGPHPLHVHLPHMCLAGSALLLSLGCCLWRLPDLSSPLQSAGPLPLPSL